MKYVSALILVLFILSGCGGGNKNKVDKDLVAVCMDDFKEYNRNCQDVCKNHGGVQFFGLAGGECAKNPPIQ
jgi:hypothetical protein